MFGVNNRNTIWGIADCCRVLSRLRCVDTIFIRHFINKSGTSKVAAKPDAEKTQSYTNMLQDVYEKLTKKLRNTKRVPFVLGKCFRSVYSACSDKYDCFFDPRAPPQYNSITQITAD